MTIERLEKLQGLDFPPLSIEKAEELQVFGYAQEITTLPDKEGTVALTVIREELQKREVSTGV